jgi:transcriptional regulator with PAS, ATPase and Fis domain
MELNSIKQRFGIIGQSPLLVRALEIATHVAPTNISVLINGESGVGKESIPKIIHHLSTRKHGAYIAVNCGAIPEGTIDSELFGHEKGSFTGAHESRKGYFEEANNGTIFLDEVAELPHSTQVRLLRVLETGEYIRVGSSKVQKTNVRVVAATNVDFVKAIQSGKFRDDLFYRLNQVPISMPALRDRGNDIVLLFKKFAADFSEKYQVPLLQLSPESEQLMLQYYWPGNIRQLKNITEQISLLETNRYVTPETLHAYLPDAGMNAAGIVRKDNRQSGDFQEKEMLYKILFDMKNEITDVKKLVLNMAQSGSQWIDNPESVALFQRLFQGAVSDDGESFESFESNSPVITVKTTGSSNSPMIVNHPMHQEIVEESLSLLDTEKEMIKKALLKHKNRRRNAAKELGISERTLYRKIKEFDLHNL